MTGDTAAEPGTVAGVSMAQYILIKKRDPTNHFDFIDVKMEFDATSLEDMLEAYKDFLAACSFLVQHMEISIGDREE